MARLEDLTVGARASGVVSGSVVTIKSVSWTGNQAIEVIFEDIGGRLDRKLLFRDDEQQLEVVAAGRPWSFEADGHLFRLVSEAQRIRLAWLFDPYVAITTSPVDPLPHQINAVYEEMLTKMPLRFLLADDPGAGKTIMAGLLIKELLLRGDLERCLIVAPGSLTDQWQDELEEKFGLSFKIFGRDMISRAHTGNPFAENHLLIARMDQLSRSDELQAKLRAAPEWDLVVCDEAHRMSAHVGADGAEPTRRYQLGKVVGNHTRNFLMMTATPHNGIEADFQCFLQLLDNDRFEGRFREGVHTADTTVLDPYIVKSGWFEIILPSLQMRVTSKVPAAFKAIAEFTLKRLKLGDGEKMIRWRRHYYARYEAGQLELDGLRVFAPLVADAAERAVIAKASKVPKAKPPKPKETSKRRARSRHPLCQSKAKGAK